MKKLLCIIMTAMLLVCAWAAALAEDDSAKHQAVENSVAERIANGGYSAILYNNQVEAEDHLAFTLLDSGYYQTLNSLILLRVELDVGLTEKARGEGVHNFNFDETDFVVISSDGQKEIVHYMSAAYLVDGDLNQRVVLPMEVPDEGTVRVMLEYIMPNTARNWCLVAPNMLTRDDGTYQTMGNLYAYMDLRTPYDFYIFNDTDIEISRAYVRPVGETEWTDNLLQKYVTTDGNRYISLVGTRYEESEADEWELGFQFTDGVFAAFSGVSLANVVDLNIFPAPDAEGKYIIGW